MNISNKRQKDAETEINCIFTSLDYKSSLFSIFSPISAVELRNRKKIKSLENLEEYIFINDRYIDNNSNTYPEVNKSSDEVKLLYCNSNVIEKSTNVCSPHISINDYMFPTKLSENSKNKLDKIHRCSWPLLNLDQIKSLIRIYKSNNNQDIFYFTDNSDKESLVELLSNYSIKTELSSISYLSNESENSKTTSRSSRSSLTRVSTIINNPKERIDVATQINNFQVVSSENLVPLHEIKFKSDSIVPKSVIDHPLQSCISSSRSLCKADRKSRTDKSNVGRSNKIESKLDKPNVVHRKDDASKEIVSCLTITIEGEQLYIRIEKNDTVRTIESCLSKCIGLHDKQMPFQENIVKSCSKSRVCKICGRSTLQDRRYAIPACVIKGGTPLRRSELIKTINERMKNVCKTLFPRKRKLL